MPEIIVYEFSLGYQWPQLPKQELTSEKHVDLLSKKEYFPYSRLEKK